MLAIYQIILWWGIGAVCGLLFGRGASYLLDELLGSLVNKYKIRTERTPLVSTEILVEVPGWRKWIIWVIPMKGETIKAELRYTFMEGENQGTWGAFDGIWEESEGKEIDITRSRRRATLRLMDISTQPFKTLGPNPMPLPNAFKMNIRLVNIEGKERAKFVSDVRID